MQKNNYILSLEKEIISNRKHHATIIVCRNEKEINEISEEIISLYKKHFPKCSTPEYVIENTSNITKDEIISLINNFSVSSNNEKRVFMIKRIDMMNEYAANSFLKFLEEPYKSVFGYMFAINDSNIIDTIKSRSSVVNLHSERKNDYFHISNLTKENVLLFSKELSTKKRQELISDFELYYIRNHEMFNFEQSEYYLKQLNNLSFLNNLSLAIDNILITI